jgi:hypothetical protein
MGRELSVDGAVALDVLLARLEAGGAPSQIVMIDGALTMPGARPPRDWGDIRLRTPSGTLALKRDGNRVAVVVFGNADAAMLEMQGKIATLLAP